MTNVLESGSGVYDLYTAAHLLGVDARNLRRWSQPSKGGHEALVPPSHGWAFSFHDLVSFAVIAVFRQRKVSAAGVRRTVEYLKREISPRTPLAHQDVVEALSTIEQRVIWADREIDLTAGGQGVLLSTIEHYLKPIEYDKRNRLAKLWRPADRVLVNPMIQVGQPCVEATRVTTEVIAGRYARGERVRIIAADLLISEDDARAALKFEDRLARGQGMALVS